MSGELHRDEKIEDGGAQSPSASAAHPAIETNGSAPVSPAVSHPATFGGAAANGNANAALIKAVDNVMYSDIGINTLLSRLKQSIASARDFAQFLKKRGGLEEEQAKGLKRLAQSHLEDVRKSERRGGTYALQLAELLRVHERMADNGVQFALSLHQMHEDLDLLSANMERGRKQWKHEGLDAEKKASDAEQAMQKAKARYENFAEDYDRARTGDTKGSRRIGLKGPKSAEQYEQDLLRKTEAADTDYKEKVRQAQSQREQLIQSDRPKAIKALQELISECDSGLTLQLQKFATFNEKLLLGNGLAVSPLADKDSSSKSMRDLVMNIDNEKDFHGYVAGHSGKVTRPCEIKYETHPTLAPKSQPPRPATAQPSQAAAAVNTQPSLAPNPAMPSQPSSVNSRTGLQSSQQTPYNQPPRTGGHDYQQGPKDMQPPANAATQPVFHASSAPFREPYTTPPYPLYPERVGNNQYQQTTGSIPAAPFHPAPSPNYPLPASTPASLSGAKGRVFGVSLEELFTRDESAVPIIVFQCIQAIDIFGLGTEGIYRHSGTHSHVNQLREKFDTLPPSSQELDFRNPSNFSHDVNAVASLLKQFFRELPDPLFTSIGYDAFIAAAKEDDENMRRDGLHQAINDLPDPNYATLRALVLHLSRVSHNVSSTRMTSENLAVCFAPTLMGNQTTGVIADSGWQSRALSVILANATAIFDED